MKEVKINTLELENVKRIKAVRLEPTKDGLTVIGGRNGQGKTSVLDAIATRVSTGDECSVIIEDGYVKASETNQGSAPKKWTPGSF